MFSSLENLNRSLFEECPILANFISRLGRSAFFPPDIPEQAAEAKGKTFNATIGQITNGKGAILTLPSLKKCINVSNIDTALLYSPLLGIERLRNRWYEISQTNNVSGIAVSRPVVTVGLTHALFLVAELFVDAGSVVVLPKPSWGNYFHIFQKNRGADVIFGQAYKGKEWNLYMYEESVKGVAKGVPIRVVVNFPSNPGGTNLSLEERREFIASLKRVADKHPLLVICDDAYEGFVYDSSPEASIFWQLLGIHDNLFPIKVDGFTKFLSFFGGRVGFITFPLDPSSLAVKALENKLKFLLRSSVGSPVAIAQEIAAEVLDSDSWEVEKLKLIQELKVRWEKLQRELGCLDSSIVEVKKCNSGCFTLLELKGTLKGKAEYLRKLLLAKEVGLISVDDSFLRIAFSSIEVEDIEPMVKIISEVCDRYV